MRFLKGLAAFLAVVSAPALGQAKALLNINVLPVDPLQKVFREDTVTSDASNYMEAARGEHATFQLVVTSAPVEITRVRCEVTTFTRVGAPNDALPFPEARFVGYIASSHSAKKPAKDQLRRAPGMYPDPLLEDKTIDIHEGDNQPLWITVHVPTDTKPGDYVASSTVYGRFFGYETSVTLPLSLKVYPATITDTRLFINNWMQMWHRGSELPMPDRYTPEWWSILRSYVRNMVEHRQNWARVETMWIVKFGRDENDKLTFDFSDFDRWVNILFDEGIDTIQSLQFAWRVGKWDEPYGVEIHDGRTKGYVGGKSYRGKMVAPDSPEADEFYSQWFPAFRQHLIEKGWLDKFVQAVGDEPVTGNADSYTSASQLLKKYAPELPIIDASLCQDLTGAIDIWVPTVEHLAQNWDFFKQRKAAGDRLWFYNCVQPEGEWANRFIELPLLKTRITHWINYRYDIEGYLHWGYNFWRPFPWDNAADGTALQGGDAFIIYPKKDGFGFLDSIRWEAMRDGIEDHELLSQLGEKNETAAQDLAKRIIIDWDKYNLDIPTFRKTRHELLEALSK